MGFILRIGGALLSSPPEKDNLSEDSGPIVSKKGHKKRSIPGKFCILPWFSFPNEKDFLNETICGNAYYHHGVKIINDNIHNYLYIFSVWIIICVFSFLSLFLYILSIVFEHFMKSFLTNLLALLDIFSHISGDFTSLLHYIISI